MQLIMIQRAILLVPTFMYSTLDIFKCKVGINIIICTIIDDPEDIIGKDIILYYNSNYITTL